MSGAIGAKVALDGEKQFKSAVADMNRSLRTFGTELKKVSSEFLGNEKSIDAYAAKNKVLEKTVDLMKDKLATQQEALKNASKEYGESSKQAETWRQSINRTETEINKLNHELSNNKKAIENTDAPMDEMTKNLKDVKDSSDKAGGSALKFGDIVKANLVSEAIISGVKSLASALKSAAVGVVNLAGESIKLAAEFGEIEAAYEQVMGADISEADKKLKGLSDSTGIVTTRLKEQFTLQSAGWKGVGKTVEESTTLAAQSIGMAADYAAFYGTSAEEAIERINSFANGNMNAAEAIGISTNAAQIAGWATQKLGVDYNKLEESEKKIIRLQFAQEMADLAGVTGQAARESGNYENVMANLAAAGDQLKVKLGSELLPVFLDVAQAFTGMMDGSIDAEEGMDRIAESITGLAQKVVDGLPGFIKAADKILMSLVKGLVKNLPKLGESVLMIVESILEIIVEELPTFVYAATQVIMSLVEGMVQMLPQLVQTGITALVEFARGIADSLPTLIPLAIEAILNIVDTLLDNIDLIVDTGILLILGLADGLVNAIPKLIDRIPTIIQSLVSAFITNAPKLIGAGIELLIKVGGGLIAAIPQLIGKVPEIISSLWNAFTEVDWLQLGKDIITGIGEGIGKWAGSVVDEGIKAAGNIVDGIKGFFGIHSPSHLMRDEIGKNLALGIGVGFDDEIDKVTRGIKDSLPNKFDVSPSVTTNLTAGGQIDYAKIGKHVAEAISRLNLSIDVDRRTFGRLVVEVSR